MQRNVEMEFASGTSIEHLLQTTFFKVLIEERLKPTGGVILPNSCSRISSSG